MQGKQAIFSNKVACDKNSYFNLIFDLLKICSILINSSFYYYFKKILKGEEGKIQPLSRSNNKNTLYWGGGKNTLYFRIIEIILVIKFIYI